MSFLGGLLTTIGKSALPLIAEYGVYKLAQAGSSLIDTIGNYISGRTNRTIGNTSSRSKTLGAMHSNIINRFTTTRPDRVNPFSGNFVEPRYEPSDFQNSYNQKQSNNSQFVNIGPTGMGINNFTNFGLFPTKNQNTGFSGQDYGFGIKPTSRKTNFGSYHSQYNKNNQLQSFQQINYDLPQEVMRSRQPFVDTQYQDLRDEPFQTIQEPQQYDKYIGELPQKKVKQLDFFREYYNKDNFPLKPGKNNYINADDYE